MKNVLVCLVTIWTVSLIGCSGGVKVTQNFERGTDYSRYKTWDWNPDSQTDQMVAASDNVAVKEYDNYVRDVVAGHMTENGLTRVQTNPDILIGYKVGMIGPSGQIDWDMDYIEQMKHADAYKSHGGIIVFDIVDARTGKQLWHGSGTGPVDIDPTPQMVKDNVRNAITKVLNQYPPE
jgi:hypothetical protein